jgi:hypothetical protein
MDLTYNSLALHELGEVIVIDQHREYEGGESPQRAKVTFNVVVNLFERAFADNYDLVKKVRAKLKTQHGQLTWKDSETDTVWVDQTATVLSENLPEDPNGWGEYFQQIRIAFQFYEHDVLSQNLVLLFTPTRATDTGEHVTLGRVTGWREELVTDRYSDLRSVRRHTGGRVTASGQFFGNPLASLADRRVSLLAQKEAMLAALNSADGSLSYGPGGLAFNRTVKAESFSAEVDQASNAIAWSAVFTYTLFPGDEADYFLVEYTAEQRDGNTGEQFLAVSGEINAATEGAARAHLEELTLVITRSYGYYSNGQELNKNSTAHQVEADADGNSFLRLNFSFEYRRFRTDNTTLTFVKTGSATPQVLGNVVQYEQKYSARRFSDMRSQRQHAGGMITASGTWLHAKPHSDLEVRRKALLQIEKKMLAEVNGADGTLVFGNHFNGVVRVDEFTAKINQAITGIDWSISVSYSLFPNEPGYATVEFNVSNRENVEDGDATMLFSGKITAQDRLAAITKLDQLRETVLAANSYTLAQRLRAEGVSQHVFANGDKTSGLSASEEADGTTFLEYNFTEEYRKRMTGLVGTTLRRSEAEDVKAGFVIITYSGTVTASGSTVDAAYATALAKARELGEGKGDFPVRSQITFDQRQTRAETGGTENVKEFVRLEFSFEYQSKATRIYFEYALATNYETFGLDEQTLSGFITGPGQSAVETVYVDFIRPQFNDFVRHGERITDSQQVLGGDDARVTQFVRRDFSLSCHLPKPENSVAIRYGIDTARNYASLEQMITVEGSVFAASETMAKAAMQALLDGQQFGSPVTERFHQDREYAPSPLLADANAFLKFDFNVSYAQRLTGVTGVLECAVTESVTYSGTRWVAQPLPRTAPGVGGISIVQDCGVEPGRRSVRGSVTAATYAAAKAWADAQRSLLTGDIDGNHYPQPEVLEPAYEFVPRIEGVVRGGGSNVRVVRLSFTFDEILPNYPYGTTPAPPPEPLLVPASLTPRIGYVYNETTKRWHKIRARNNADGVVEEFLDEVGVL